MLSPSRASFYGRYAYRRQLPAEVLNSFGTETALLGQFVLVRFFETKPWETTLFFSLMHLSFFLSPWFAEQMRGRPTRPFFFVMMAISLPAFLATALTRGFWGIGPSLLVANIAFVAIFVPLRNRLMRSNYADAERGAAYATFKRTSALTFFGCALWAAHSLESDRSLIHVVLPIAGLLSAAGLYLFSRIRERGETWRLRSETDRPRRGFVDVYRDLFRLYRDEPGFRRYQIAFLIYGLGFMFTIPP
ncbi:MAG: hypothetical protein KDB53_05230, partial [Planctomycetes bacterium]|nr:hypothetical protein [Planctomycetota bacterium]